MTTIGWRNHRYFLLFLLYVLLGCSFVALTGMERFHGGPRVRVILFLCVFRSFHLPGVPLFLSRDPLALRYSHTC